MRRLGAHWGAGVLQQVACVWVCVCSTRLLPYRVHGRMDMGRGSRGGISEVGYLPVLDAWGSYGICPCWTHRNQGGHTKGAEGLDWLVRSTVASVGASM